MGNENPVPHEEDYDIRILRDGTWWHNGGRIDRIGLIRLFASVLSRGDNGEFWLITPAERGKILVEDAPFVAIEMRVEGDGRDRILSFRTNLDEWVEAGPDHPVIVRRDEAGEAKPYIEVRNGLEATMARAVYYDLIDLVEEWTSKDAKTTMGVWSRGRFFPLEP